MILALILALNFGLRACEMERQRIELDIEATAADQEHKTVTKIWGEQ